MKTGFTIVEISILFVIFLIVAFLVAPMSLDDSVKANNISRWRSVQSDFDNIFYMIKSQDNYDEQFSAIFDAAINKEIKAEYNKPYTIRYYNGANSVKDYKFQKYYITQANAILAVNLFDKINADGERGYLMYDINGIKAPNTWGKDVFGLKISDEGFIPFCKEQSFEYQKKDCSKSGKGLCCSSYYIIGGNFD